MAHHGRAFPGQPLLHPSLAISTPEAASDALEVWIKKTGGTPQYKHRYIIAQLAGALVGAGALMFGSRRGPRGKIRR